MQYTIKPVCCLLAEDAFMVPCIHSLLTDKENLDRSDASINLGFESPTVKLVSAELKVLLAGMTLVVFTTAQKMNHTKAHQSISLQLTHHHTTFAGGHCTN